MTDYAAWWPILDDDATLSTLTTQAHDELVDMITATGHRLAGPVQWATQDDAGTLALLALAPVEPIAGPHVSPYTHDHAGSAVVEDIEFLLDADPALTTRGAADRLRIQPESVLRALRRAGRDDLRARLTTNTGRTAA